MEINAASALANNEEKNMTDKFFANSKTPLKVRLNELQGQYQKSKFKSCYGTFFGRKPDFKSFKDMKILKFFKFSNLQCSQILSRYTVECLDKWQRTKENPDYLGKKIR